MLIFFYIRTFLGLAFEMAPYLLLGFLFAGLLHSFVPARFYNAYLSKNDWRSVLMAAAVGIPLPLCSCGVIPTAMSLRRNGASKGATVSFLISTPQTGVDSILATGSIMGWPMAIIRPIVALVTAVVGGGLVNRFDRGETPADIAEATPVPTYSGFADRVRGALRYGFVDMVQDIGKWLVIGLLVAGLITVFVPDDFFDTFASVPLLNMLIVLVLAVPMYVCATGSIPIAMALMMKGLSPGAALVFLMAGPATNMAAIMVINKVMQRRTLLIYLATIVGGAILFGTLIDAIFYRETLMAGAHGYCCFASHHSALQIWSLIILAGLLINAYRHKHKHSHKAETMEKNTVIFNVAGMSCNHCKANVERTVAAMPGVETCEVDLQKGTLTIVGTVDPADVCRTVDQLGYTCSPRS